MGGFGSKMWRVAAVGALVAAGTGASVSSASAGIGSQISGAATCDPQTGETIITWTFYNGFNAVVDITSNSIDDAALNAGSITEASGLFTPASQLAFQDTATAITHASPDASGNVTMTLLYTPFDTGVQTISGTASLEGCTVPSTTVAPTTTSPTTTAAPVTTLLGSGGASLPSSGNGSTLPVLAGLMVATGGGMLLLRRRNVTN